MLIKAWTYATGIAVLVAISTGCKEKKSGKDIAPATNSAPCDSSKDPSCKGLQTGTGGGTALVDVCGGVNQNAALKDYSALNSIICASGTQGMQSLTSGVLYTGSGTSTIKDLSSEELAQKQSKIKLIGAMRVNTKPLSYFNLMKLEISQPSQFKSAGFESDDKVSYEVKSTSGDTTTYRYKNTSEAPEVVVDYTASARFVVLVPDKVYLVATSLDTSASNETVEALKGYSLIFASSATTTDVLSISDQTYDNNGNHQTTLNKAKRAAQTEQLRSYRNGQMADKANALVK